MPFVLGLNHRTASIDLREKLAVFPNTVAQALAELKQTIPVEEVVVLSTCNRFEIYGEARDSAVTREALPAYLARHLQSPLAGDQLYFHEREEAVKHLFRVASGLDSLVPG